MRRIVFLGALVLLSPLTPPPAAADIIYEVNGSATSTGSVGVYSTNGTPINTGLITGLFDPVGIALDSSGNIYVAYAANTVGKFSNSGAALNPTFITGLSYPGGMTIASGNLYVPTSTSIGQYPLAGGAANPNFISAAGVDIAVGPNGNFYATNANAGTITEYTSSGALVGGGPLVSGLRTPNGIAIDLAGNLYVTLEGSQSVNEYSSNGTLLQSNLITGLDNPFGIAIDGSDLYVANFGSGSAGTGYIGDYTTSGQTVNSDLIGGLTDTYSLAIASVPEPGSAMLTGIVASIIALALWCRRRRHNALITSIGHLSR